jgi:hypothetical protein
MKSIILAAFHFNFDLKRTKMHKQVLRLYIEFLKMLSIKKH